MKLKKISIKKYTQAITLFWLNQYKIFFIILFLGLAAFGAFLWYETFYRFGWSDEQKKQYTLTQNRSINLKESEFNSMAEIIENKKNKFESPSEHLKDIFKSE
jgi:hypothetical protein